MDKFRQLIKDLRVNTGKSQQDIANELGVSQVTVFRLENGKMKFTEEYMRKFADLYNTTVQDIMEGKFNTDYVPTENVKIDIISATACCGNGNETDEEVIGSMRLPYENFRTLTYAPPHKIKMLQVSGDSMKPTINDGDFVMVDTSITSPADGVYIIRMLTGLAVKRIQVGMDKINIVSDNPLYQPLTASAGEINIVGKVINIFNINKV